MLIAVNTCWPGLASMSGITMVSSYGLYNGLYNPVFLC